MTLPLSRRPRILTGLTLALALTIAHGADAGVSFEFSASAWHVSGVTAQASPTERGWVLLCAVLEVS